MLQCFNNIVNFRFNNYINIFEMEPPKLEETAIKKKVSLTPQDFNIKYRLGKGAYGDVFLVIKNSDRKTYAMKQIQKKKLQREQKEYQAIVEKQLLSSFKHPGIVKLRSSFQDKQSLYFVLEYCEGGEFISFIKTNIDKLNEDIKVFYIAQMVNLLEYIHKNGVTHRDLKPENLMLDRRGHLKLIDFGTAQITNASILKKQFKEHILKLKQKAELLIRPKERVDEESSEPSEVQSPKKRRSTFVGTCYYISPELLQQNYCPPSADLWALGCIIYQLYYLETPFKDNYEFAVFEKIKKAEVSFPKISKNDIITEEAIDLIKRLLIKNPEQRLGSGTTEALSFKQLKAHPYFKGLDIDNIFNLPVPYVPGLQIIEPHDNAVTNQKLQIFKASQEQILNKITSEGNQIVKNEIVEQKPFIVFNFALLVYCSNKKLFLINSQQTDKKRQLKLKANSQSRCKIEHNNTLVVEEEDRITQLRTASAQQWLQIILAI